MSPERQALLLAIAERVRHARMVLQVREARLDTICKRPRDFRADELLAARWRVVEGVEEVNAWCAIFERETRDAIPPDVITEFSLLPGEDPDQMTRRAFR